MSSATVRIREETRNILREISAQTGQPMQTILDKAIEEYRRQRFLDEANMAYAILKKNRKEWKAELEERKLWDSALSNGQEGD